MVATPARRAQGDCLESFVSFYVRRALGRWLFLSALYSVVCVQFSAVEASGLRPIQHQMRFLHVVARQRQRL